MERYNPDDCYQASTVNRKTTVLPATTKKVVSSTWKVDTKDVPKLPKNKSGRVCVHTWEQVFRVKMDLAKVSELLKQIHWFDKKDPEKADVKDVYLKSCLVTATMEITAYCKVSSLEKLGREIWFDLLTAYLVHRL